MRKLLLTLILCLLPITAFADWRFNPFTGKSDYYEKSTPWTSDINGSSYNLTTTGNITAGFFLGNGSQLTGITGGGHDAVTIENTTDVFFTLVGQKINATINATDKAAWNDKGSSNLTIAQVMALANLTYYYNQTTLYNLTTLSFFYNKTDSDARFAPISITQYTDELAQDAIGGAFLPTASIVPTYTDAANSMTWAVNTSWIVPAGQLSDGSALKSLNAANLTTGIAPASALSDGSALKSMNASNLSVGIVGADRLSSGAALASINAANISSGVVAAARLSAGSALQGLVAGNITAATSATWLGAVSDETGTGNWVFNITPTLATPIIGVATGTSLNLTGTGNSTFNCSLGIMVAAPTTVLDILGADNTTIMRIKNNANQAATTAADIFISLDSTTGVEATIAGTAVAGVIAYNTFTGSHWTKAEGNPEVGELLEITEGTIPNKQQLFTTKVCSTKKSNKAVGVFGGTDPNGNDLVLSLGTGVIYVANKNKDLDIGDYLISSNVRGCAEKQRDDIYRSSTVAKTTEKVKWKPNEKRRLIKCVYLGG